MPQASTRLCKPLTRPATIIGVYLGYLVLCFCFCAVLFIWTRSNILAAATFAILYGLGAYATSKDPFYLDIIGIYITRCRTRLSPNPRDAVWNVGGRNLAFWKARSFAP